MPAPGQLERDPPAERVAGDVRTVEPDLGQEGGDERGERADAGWRARRRHRGGAEAGEVEGDDLPLGFETVDHRSPALPAVADTVDEHKRGSGPRAVMIEPHGPGTLTGSAKRWYPNGACRETGASGLDN